MWNTGVWNQSEYGIRHGVNEFGIYDTGNTTVSGHLNISKVLNLQRLPGISDTSPLITTSSSSTGWVFEKLNQH